MSVYEDFIAKGHYCRWLEEGRRETWEEVVTRYTTFMEKQSGISLSNAREAILRKEVMPSMRALMTAGLALERDHVAGYNCAYMSIDHPRCFDEMLYVLMCGTGMGFSVERQFVNKLPEVAEEFHETDSVISVRDSKVGWAKAIKELVSLLYAGQIPQFDTSKLRPAGARLRVFGGRASGPEPLIRLYKFTVELFKQAAGRKLSSLECHDLCCMIADCVVAGGVRRSALISLSNLTDDRMRRAKQGEWRLHSKHRELSNNSVCYTEKPDFQAFMSEWSSLYESFSGERGIYFREAAKRQAGRSGRRDTDHNFGTNPCSEIILRPNQFCNLSEVIIRRTDTLADLRRKVTIATILGTIQSTLTDFRYIRPIWKKQCEEERLLGVSLTGIMDHPIMNGVGIQDATLCHEFCGNEDVSLPEILEELKQVAITTNAEVADKLGIPHSTAITCIKPSGTVSQLVDSASGIHPRYSQHYIRRVRVSKNDPLAEFMRDQGVPCYPKGDVIIFEFPKAAPEGALTAAEFLGIRQLELWKIYQDHWCEHKPSMTVYYRDSDFFEIGQWVYNHFEDISGVSFLPYSDHVYEDAPYEPISEEEFKRRESTMPAVIDWSLLSKYELDDNTTGSQEYACTGTSCEIVDIGANHD